MSLLWINPEDRHRWHVLTEALRRLVANGPGRDDRKAVAPHHLALYLEWFALAREGASSDGMFLLYSSPDALQGLSYREMARNFQLLLPQIPVTAGAAEADG